MTAVGTGAASAPRLGPGRGEALQICALIGTAQMTWGVIVPVLPLLVDVLSMPLVLLGPVIAAFAIGRVIANVPAGLALRRFSARPMMLGVLVLLAGVTAVTGLAPDAAWLIGLRFVAGMLGGAAITLGFAVLFAGAPAGRRGRVISLATIVQMGAAALGAMLGGVAVTIAGVPGAFVTAAIPVLLAVVVDLIRPARSYWHAVAGRATASVDAMAPVPGAGTTRVLVGLAAVSFALFFARFAGEQGIIPVLAYSQGGLDPLTLGIAFALGTAVSAAALPWVGRWVDRGARTAVLAGSTAAAGAVIVLMGATVSPWWFGAAIVAYAVSTSVANIVPSVVTAELFPGRSAGATVGVTRTAGDVGAAVGPVVVFALVDTAGMLPALAVLALVPVAAVVWLLLALRR